MVDVAPVQTFYQELSREPKVFTNLESFFVDVFGGEVFSDTTIVCVAQFDLVIFMIKQIVYVHIVHVSLNVFEINV